MGPDLWNEQEYKLTLEQMGKMKMVRLSYANMWTASNSPTLKQASKQRKSSSLLTLQLFIRRRLPLPHAEQADDSHVLHWVDRTHLPRIHKRTYSVQCKWGAANAFYMPVYKTIIT